MESSDCDCHAKWRQADPSHTGRIVTTLGTSVVASSCCRCSSTAKSVNMSSRSSIKSAPASAICRISTSACSKVLAVTLVHSSVLACACWVVCTAAFCMVALSTDVRRPPTVDTLAVLLYCKFGLQCKSCVVSVRECGGFCCFDERACTWRCTIPGTTGCCKHCITLQQSFPHKEPSPRANETVGSSGVT